LTRTRSAASGKSRQIGLRYVDQAEIERTYRDTWKHQERITIEMPIDHVIANGF